MGSPLMYESDPREYGGKKTRDNQTIFFDDHTNVLDLDPQEIAFDFEPYILNPAPGVPNPVAVTSSAPPDNTQPSTVSDLTTVNLGIFTQAQETATTYQTVPQMPQVQLFMQPEEPAIPRNFDLTTENSVDIQALLNYTGANVVKDEKSDDIQSCSLLNFENELELTPRTEPAEQGTSTTKEPAPGPTRKGKSKKRFPAKGSEEYVEKRARNNIAVRKSRTKAKQRQAETEGRVKILTDENERLQKKVDLLSKELNVLKSLFLNVGAALPAEFESVLQK